MPSSADDTQMPTPSTLGGSNYAPSPMKWVDIHTQDGTVTRLTGDSCLVVVLAKTAPVEDTFIDSVMALTESQPPIISVHTDNPVSMFAMLGGAIATVENVHPGLVAAAQLYAEGLEFSETDPANLQDVLNTQTQTKDTN